MPEPNIPEGTSIADALQMGLNSTPEGDGGSPDNPDDKQPDGNGKPAPEAGKDPANPDEAAKDTQDPGKGTDLEKGKDSVKPQEGEYTKERFDGLMSAWQTDKAKLAQMEKDIAEIKAGNSQPKNEDASANNPDEVELPDELKDADPEAQQGYKIVAKGVNKMLQNAEKRITGKLLEIINQPLKQQNELKTKIDNEIAELKVSIGPEFEKNIKAVLQFAIDEGYPQGSLNLAFKNWQVRQQHQAEIEKLGGAKKKIDEIKAEDRKDAGIPTGGKNKTGEIPSFDAARDGEKTISQLLRETADLI